jgi:hypothetical protein
MGHRHGVGADIRRADGVGHQNPSAESALGYTRRRGDGGGEWEPEHAIGLHVHDANMEASGRATFEAEGPDRTVLTVITDFPGLDESKVEVVTVLMERSIANVKALVESET